MQFNKEDIRLWVETLRSNEYPQTHTNLQNVNGYDVMGVACRLFIPPNKLIEENGMLVGSLIYSQPNAPEWLLKLNDDFYKKHYTSLSYLNDNGKTFSELADLLELYYLSNKPTITTPEDFLIPRWLVLGHWPGREPGKFNVGDIISDNGNPRELPLDQNGNRRFRLQWEECPCLFKKLKWWEEREISEMKSIKYIKNTKWNRFYQVLEMVPAFSISQDIYSFKAKNRKGQEVVGYIDLTDEYIPTTEEEFNQGR
jgi:hypothetical protein